MDGHAGAMKFVADATALIPNDKLGSLHGFRDSNAGSASL